MDMVRIDSIISKAKYIRSIEPKITWFEPIKDKFDLDYTVITNAFIVGDKELCLEGLLGDILFLQENNICTIGEIPNYITKGKSWFYNGELHKEVDYLSGKRNGFSIEYDVYGNILLIKSYLNDKLNGTVTYYDNTNLIMESNYIDNISDGIHREWWKNGTLKYDYTMLNGERNGSSKLYHDNGQIFVDCTFNNGFLDGSYKKFDKNGELLIERIFNNECLYGYGKISNPNDYLTIEYKRTSTGNRIII